jgi:class 3 adenylate cyclase
MRVCGECGAPLPAGARFCPDCGAPTDPQRPIGERKLATVLFADLVGSTALGEQDPERTRALLDRFYDAMAGDITRAGGAVEKFVGDAVVAAFGVPAAQEDHAERALHAALSMKRGLQESFGDTLSLRIGINSGEVIAVRPREGSSFVTGDVVNVAARLEQSAAPGEILVGERTVASARGAFEFGEPSTIEAKGKRGGIPCRRLIRALSLVRPRGIEGLGQSFVGRESELELLQATYHRVVSKREPHCVTIMGNAGVGKTRLVDELWGWLGPGLSEPLRLTGRCIPYGRAITYWPLGEILKQHLGILENDPAETVLRRLGARQALGLTLGMEAGHLGHLHPLAVRDRLHQAWVEFVEELVADRTAVVLVEDLHWAEEPLLDLLEGVLHDARGPLLLLATARPELLDRRPAWGGGRRNAATLWLEPLSSAEASRMLDELLATRLPANLGEMVIERAEGNPFFVEELVAALIDQGVLERTNGNWVERQVQSDLTIPDSVQAALAARIDLLGPTEKAALQAAAVIGRVFWAGPVSELLEGAEPDFGILEDRDFIRRRSRSSLAGEREFFFKHTLTREVAYSILPKAKRGQLHAAVAGWIERFVEGRDELAPFLAHHYAESVRPEDADLAWAGEMERLLELQEKAVVWLRRAAELAVGRYEVDEGLGLLHRALELDSSESGQAALWHEIGHANALKYDGEAFWTSMQNAIGANVNRQERADLFGELAFQTAIRSGMWVRRPDPKLVESWIEQALELAVPESPARAKALIARSHWRPEESEDAAREASVIAERLEEDELRSYALDSLAVTAFASNRFDECWSWAEKRLSFLDSVSDPGHRASVLACATLGSLACGRFRDARRFALQHREVTRRLTPHHQLHGIAYLLEVHELAGDWESVRDLRPQTEHAVAANLATPCVLNSRSLLVCALASAQLADEEEARRLARSSEALRMEGYDVLLDPPRIQLALRRGDLRTVARLVREADVPGRETWGQLAALATWLDAFAALGERERVESAAPPLLQPGTYLEPFALRALGIVRETPALVAQAARRFAALELHWHAAKTRTLLP